jgi:Mg2+ and Co2+ transporter CorA
MYDQTEKLIEIVGDRHNAIIDDLTFQESEKLNKISYWFAMTEMCFMPVCCVGGFFGMNVLVPM